MEYNNLIVAGTFDRFHKGHEAYILYGLSHAKHIFLTITSDRYAAIHKPHVAPFIERVRQVEGFLKKHHVLEKVTILPIDDVYGISLDKNISPDAILVTKKTLLGARLVNEKRKEKGLKPFSIIIAPLTHGQNQNPISSSLIRQGSIDRSGTLFVDPKWTTKTHLLPEELRERFHEPFGELITDLPKTEDAKTVTVGDVTTKRFLDNGRKPILSIIDFVVERTPQFYDMKELGFSGKEHILSLVNPPGKITKEVWKNIEQALTFVQQAEQVVIKVEGEEDLTVLPLVLTLPLNFDIFYGQPHKGLIHLQVTESMKKEVYKLLKKFL